jgi:DNA polymerase-1
MSKLTHKKLLIIDLSNLIFRAFFAIRPLTSPEGVPVNAVYGVLTMLNKILDQHKPTHVLVAMDSKEDSFRKEEYADYKAHRTEAPDDLIPQFYLIDELIIKMKLPFLKMPRFEADDIIGSCVIQHGHEFEQVIIVSGDKDLMQFVNEKVNILDTMKDKLYTSSDVFEKMGVYPDQIVDYLSMVGDSSDNIPGVPGVGAKGAAQLLLEFKSLDGIYQNIEAINNKRLKNGLLENKHLADLSKKLVQIKTDMELNVSSDFYQYKLEIGDEFVAFITKLGFKNYLEKMGLKKTQKPIEPSKVQSSYKKIQELKDLDLITSGLWAMELISDDQSSQFSHPLFVFLSKEDNFVFIEFNKIHFEPRLFWQKLESISLVNWDLKNIYYQLIEHNCSLKRVDDRDIRQAFFILNPDLKNNEANVTKLILDQELPEIESLSPMIEMSEDQIQNIHHRLSSLLDLNNELNLKLAEKKLLYPYQNLDLPLIPVLAQIERHGVKIDQVHFQELSHEFSNLLAKIEAEVQAETGETFNLKSPKQVGFVLFEKLRLPVIKKTKTGYSTDAEVLEELSKLNLSSIPAKLLKYREVDKLLSTYVATLPKLISPKTNKLHTHYQLGNAATGRLSSDHPNLQNIPIRTEQGKRLRKGFIPDPGCVLLSADYSQVELRLLAHLSSDDVMVKAFLNDQDIHIQTASEIFEIPLDKVSKDQRNSAKAINFGLMYGQSSFGLSQTLGIPQNEAKNYINNYFHRFKGVKSYLDSLKELCEKTGYAETMFERKRYLPDIHSTNRQIKALAERVAINSPIQGSAADIIKKAMIEIDQEFKNNKIRSTMIMQVHDELVFNVYPEEFNWVKEKVQFFMENTVKLSVPLKVDMGSGANWLDLKDL